MLIQIQQMNVLFSKISIKFNHFIFLDLKVWLSKGSIVAYSLSG